MPALHQSLNALWLENFHFKKNQVSQRDFAIKRNEKKIKDTSQVIEKIFIHSKIDEENKCTRIARVKT